LVQSLALQKKKKKVCTCTSKVTILAILRRLYMTAESMLLTYSEKSDFHLH
jgi:hypothetical protein